MSEKQYTAAERARLLEVWLPIATNANERYGWKLTRGDLETLVFETLVKLQQSSSTLEAYGILWQQYVSRNSNTAS